MMSNFLHRLVEWVKGNEVLSRLLTITSPKVRSNKKRQSLMEMQGFELTAKSQLHTFRKKLKVRTTSEYQVSKYLQPLAPEETISIVTDFYEKISQKKGKVTAKELHSALSKNLPQKEIGEKLLKCFRFRLQNEITLQEAIEAIAGKQKIKFSTDVIPSLIEHQLTEVLKSNKKIAVMKSLFDKYDTNKNGFLTLPDLKKALRDNFTIPTIEKMFADNDTDNDGQLSFEDFLRIYSED